MIQTCMEIEYQEFNMANILILTNRPPWPIEDGGALRVLNLAKELSNHNNCHILYFSDNDDMLLNINNLGIFTSATNIIPIIKEKKSWRRHLRFSDENYLQISDPVGFNTTVNEINDYIKKNKIDIVIAMGIFVAEYLDYLDDVKKVVDDCDCRTLSIERQFSVIRPKLSMIDKLKYVRDIARIKAQESKLTKKYDLITTISPADLERIQQLNGTEGSPVVLIPNGVTNDLLTANYNQPEIANAIAFWGNLSFPPNRNAIEYFCEQIYLPYLQPKGVKWFVIGKNPGVLLTERAEKYDSIFLTGFVEDLFNLASTIPVMINPMISGSGQKNKVLEAFMLAKGVVSTSMGMESFPAIHNEHCLIADKPKVFAQSVIELLRDNFKRVELGHAARQLVLENYTWEKVGQMLNISIRRLSSN